MVLVRPEENRLNDDSGKSAASVNVKTPKRILHFSDGVLEEYSTDDEETTPSQEQTVVDPSTLTWGPWFWYKAMGAGSSTVYVVDRIGEFLASFFGITTPRYYFELEEYKRREEIKKKTEEEEKGWSRPSDAAIPLTEIRSKEPRPVDV